MKICISSKAEALLPSSISTQTLTQVGMTFISLSEGVRYESGRISAYNQFVVTKRTVHTATTLQVVAQAIGNIGFQSALSLSV